MDEQYPWHRLFGLSWMDFFSGLPVHVEMEIDLSLKQQWLDVVIIRKETTELPCRLPDGFEDLAPHNLVTFKSHQETLDAFALEELIGHGVNYRKQNGPSPQELLPREDVRLVAVSVRSPHNLMQHLDARLIQPGVYEVRYFGLSLRLVVVHELPRQEHNALLHLFSARTDLVRYGAQHYRLHSAQTTTLLIQLIQSYLTEGQLMPNQLEEFARQTIDELLRRLPPEERLKGLSPEQRLEGLSPEQRLEGLSPEERLANMSLDEVLAALPPQAREALARQFRELGSSSPPG